MIARQIHRWSRRHDKPFVVVKLQDASKRRSCSKANFRTRPAARYGAVRTARPPRSSLRRHVFLDEIADLTPPQRKFLRLSAGSEISNASAANIRPRRRAK